MCVLEGVSSTVRQVVYNFASEFISFLQRASRSVRAESLRPFQVLPDCDTALGTLTVLGMVWLSRARNVSEFCRALSASLIPLPFLLSFLTGVLFAPTVSGSHAVKQLSLIIFDKCLEEKTKPVCIWRALSYVK